MEPVQLDFIYGGNTQAEGAKIIATTEQIATAHADATKMVARHSATIVELKKDLVELGTAYKQATTKAGKSEILSEIELTKKNIIDETAALKQLKAEMASMNKMPKAAAAPDAAQAGRAAVGYSSLSFSTQQIVRELPAATMGLNMFFLAISNNIPTLTDGIKRARAENELLKKSGASTTPVWKQLMSSILSWQSLMMVGITVASMYGKEIFQAFSKGSEAAERAAESTKKFNDAFAQSAAEPLAKVNQLADKWSKLGDNLNEKKKFVDANKEAFRDLGVEVNNVKDAENLLNAGLPAFQQAMMAKAMSVAAMSVATEKYQEYFKKMREAEKMKADGPTLGDKFMSVISEGYAEQVPGAPAGKRGISPQEQLAQKVSAMHAEAEAIKGEGDALIKVSNEQNDIKDAILEAAGIKRLTKEETIRQRSHTAAYNSESDFQKLIDSLKEKSESMLIGLKEDGLAKRLDVIQQEKDKELAAIREKEIAIINEYNATQKKRTDEHNAANPKAKKAYTPLSTESGDIGSSLAIINPEQAQQLATATLAVEDAFRAKSTSATEDWYDEIKDLALEFATKSEQIKASYLEKIKKLEANGQAEIAAIAYTEMNEKISQEERSLIEETNIYKYATDDKIRLTKEMNAKLIQLVKDRINATEGLSEKDKKALITKVDNSDAGKSNTALDGLIKSFTGLKKAKEDSAKATELGDVEGAAEAAKNIEALQGSLMSYGSAIIGYFDQAAAGVIGIMDQMGAFTEEEKQMAEDVVGTVSSAATLAVGIASGDVGSIISGAIGTISGLFKVFDSKGRDIAKKQKAIEKSINDLSAAYKRLQYAVEDALGTDVYTQQRNQVANLQAQIAANNAWIEQENRKKRKKRDQNAIAERREQMEELRQQIEDVKDAITESLAGTNAKDLAGQLSDALTAAFQSGQSAAEAMGDTVNSVLRNAVTNALKLQFLEKPMQKAVEDLAASMEDGALSSDESSTFEKQIRSAGEQYYQMLAQYSDLFTADNAGKATGIKGDVAKMTEETGSALTGQIVAMRLNVAAILTNSKSSVDIMGKQLAVLEEIKTNTSFCRRLDRIDDTLYYIKLNGVKVQ